MSDEILNDRLLDLAKVKEKIGFGRTKIYEMINEGDFPPGKMVENRRRWRESEIDRWIERAWSKAS